jgi:hypothetical protein
VCAARATCALGSCKPSTDSNLYFNIYEIDLSSNIKARWFLNASRLIKARNNLVLGQLLKSEDSVNINKELE